MSDVGSATEEAVKLFAAMEDWARKKAGSVLDEEHVATGSAECQMCPVCQGIGVLRHDAAASLVAALKTAVTTPPAADGSHRHPQRVQHIDVSGAE